METVFLVVTVTTITVLMLLCASILIGRRTITSRLAALFLFLLACYISLPVVDYAAIHPVLSFLVARASSLIPAVIWLLAYRLFRPGDKVPLIGWGAIAMYLALRSVGIGLFSTGVVENSLLFYGFSVALPQLIMISLSVHAIYLALSEFTADLIESRRRLRVGFVVASALLIILTRIKTWIVYNSLVQGIPLEAIPTEKFDGLILLYALSLSLAFYFMALKVSTAADALFASGISGQPNREMVRLRVSRDDKALIERIQKKMAQDRVFEEPRLTVNAFASQLAIHPHKLRSVISSYFECSNFNQFLNAYRVNAAKQLLCETSVSISAIATIVGFSSLSAFNASFKASAGMTPSRYRIEQGENLAQGNNKVSNVLGTLIT
jgi:AraC-like DNA-binding protein